jgi:hypothetical protein
MATSRTVFVVSTREIGHQPSSFRVSEAEAPFDLRMMYTVMVALMRHERVTARMRARMDEGASRESCGEGRVAAER